MSCLCNAGRLAGFAPGEAHGWVAVTEDGDCAFPVGNGCCRVFADELSALDAVIQSGMTGVSLVSVTL
jgi:hypothetical protein